MNFDQTFIETLLEGLGKSFLVLVTRVGTDLEKCLNLTLVLENSWNLERVPFARLPRALEIMENHEKKFHAWKNHGISKKPE